MGDQKANTGTRDFVLGTVVGGIIGAAAALMLAPKSGKELRDSLNEQAQIAKLKTSNIRESATELTEQAKRKTSEFASIVTDQSSQVAEKVKEVTNHVKDDVKKLREKAIPTGESKEQEEARVEDIKAEIERLHTTMTEMENSEKQPQNN